ncbi:G-TYPE LECTIN S-RECEPTOR-LIKE SERINE/THREONINE-PROTEIN KINASE RLK1 [Salix viminalis]|uniref:Receptor-like serine/threonine-protein kinase n=2 Tax=Salix TaxID=40685 RepID=A0A9Q0TM65_SALVM|nr:G-TYPE LECTIN S-RECEPTOR-LIKE SERINE/THREONINE-PROTEIN KINASE RLK1 [Salix viminalis]
MAFLLPYSSCLLFLVILPQPFPATAESYKHITLGLSLTASNNNDSWRSPSGEFAFGFQQVGDDGFLLAIWFNKIPEKTIVWSANRNNLAQRGDEVKLMEDGQLVLNDRKGKQIWRADTAGSRVAYAAMLDTGNFVLARHDSVNVWESFLQPTDTLLPTQTFRQGSKLVAGYSSMNHSTGRYLFTLQIDGNLVLYTLAFPLDSVNSPYWSSETVGNGFLLSFNQSGNIYLAAKNGSMLVMLSSDPPPTRDFYHVAILEYDGVFRHYVYPKSMNPGVPGWPMRWSPLTSSFKPPNICTSIREKNGCGACGFNSYCNLGIDQRPKCSCPPGYTFLDPNDVMKGCKQDFVSQNCEEAPQETELFYFEQKENTDWPLSDSEHFSFVTEEWCRKACLSDCFCVVAIFRDGDCWKKKIPLSNGRFDPSVGGKALIKIRKDNSTLNPADDDVPKNKSRSTIIIIKSLLVVSSVSLNFLFILKTLLDVLRFGYGKTKKLYLEPTDPGITLRSFTFNELEKATSNFKEELGSGAFATVYKGTLDFDERTFVAVKNLDRMVRDCKKEFKAEVNAIGRTNHKNLVKLLGFCNEGEHRLLVYELLRNGNLANFLFGDPRLNWKNFEPEVKDEDQMVLAYWAYDCYKDGEVGLLVEADEDAVLDMKRVVKFVMIAIWCIQEDPSLRPTMKKVTQMMEGTVEVSAPPDPSSFISSIESF